MDESVARWTADGVSLKKVDSNNIHRSVGILNDSETAEAVASILQGRLELKAAIAEMEKKPDEVSDLYLAGHKNALKILE